MGHDDVRLAPATPADAVAIAELHTEVWREVYRGIVSDHYLDTVTVTDRAARWTERLTSGTRRAVLGRAGGTVVGAISWSVDGGVTELASLYIARSHRGTGLGRRLVETTIGDGPARLWVFEANVRARDFYRRLGFTTETARAVDPGTGAYEIRVERPTTGA